MHSTRMLPGRALYTAVALKETDFCVCVCVFRENVTFNFSRLEWR